MTLYRADGPAAMSATKGWSAETFYARFTQRLLTALSSPTAEGELYPVDLRLRPSGSAGPVAVSLAALERYYAAEAETWEFMALTRARVVWASSDVFAQVASASISSALHHPREPMRLRRDARAMRALMAKEKPPAHGWDLKLGEGGLVDIEFVAQTLQLIHAADDAPFETNTGAALERLTARGILSAEDFQALYDAWRLQQDLQQVLKVALADDADPREEPTRFRAILAKAGGVRTFAALETRLSTSRRAAHQTFKRIFAGA